MLPGIKTIVYATDLETGSADLIIMGTHRHTAIGEMLLGSTAQKVVHSSEIPTLLIRVPKPH